MANGLSTDRVKELKKLNHALLLTFTELTNVLVHNPMQV
jgi:hypothetical protein